MPRDYIPVEVERHVRQAARQRCGYCLSPQRLVMARLEIEQMIPVAKGGDNSESNLWLSFAPGAVKTMTSGAGSGTDDAPEEKAMSVMVLA